MKHEWPEIVNGEHGGAEVSGREVQTRDDFLKEINKDLDKTQDPAGPIALVLSAVFLGGKLLFSSGASISPAIPSKPVSIPTTVGFRMEDVLIETKNTEPNEQTATGNPCSRLPNTVVIGTDRDDQDKKILVHKCRVVENDKQNGEDEPTSEY